MKEEKTNLAIYTSDDGYVVVDVKVDHENIWLTQKQMASVFDCSTDNV